MFTCANQRYEDFAPLYAAAVLTHIPGASVEIGVEDLTGFEARHATALALLRSAFPADRLHFRDAVWRINGKRILPNTVRFLEEPTVMSKYVYIGDIDIIILDPELLQSH